METGHGNIIKAKVEENYVRIENSVARDSNLSLKARGLLLFLQSFPSDWVIHKTKLASLIYPDSKKEGRDAIIAGFNELIEHGYILQIEKVINNNLKVYDYIVYPTSQIPRDGFSVTGIPSTENQALTKESTTKKVQQKKEIVKESEQEFLDRMKAWYYEQATASTGLKNNAEYRGFCRYIFADNPTKAPILHLLKIEHQVTYDNFETLLGVADLKDIYEKVDVMINNPKYAKNKQYVHLTLLNWLRK